MKILLAALASVAIGLVIWRIDSQPNWDDTGVTVGMILLSTGLISFISPRKPFVVAIAVSVWIPLFGIIGHGNYGTLIALVFGFIGAYGGSLVRNALAF